MPLVGVAQGRDKGMRAGRQAGGLSQHLPLPFCWGRESAWMVAESLGVLLLPHLWF